MTKRSQASVALEAISESVALRAKHMKMIEEGKQAADRGELIPHDEVIAWVESLGTNNELPMPQSSVSK
jgi:predicted transcriptional regulator